MNYCLKTYLLIFGFSICSTVAFAAESDSRASLEPNQFFIQTMIAQKDHLQRLRQGLINTRLDQKDSGKHCIQLIDTIMNVVYQEPSDLITNAHENSAMLQQLITLVADENVVQREVADFKKGLAILQQHLPN